MTPTIFARDLSGLLPVPDEYSWGRQPANPWAVTVHHSAGPRARNIAQAQALHRSYQREHMAKGWGDIGYHLSMDDLGRFYHLRALDSVGTHVGSHNTGNLGLMLHGNYDHDRLTKEQKASLKWLFRGGFAQVFGVTEHDLSIVRGHQEWPGPTNQGNACPGVNLMGYWRYLRNSETW